MQRTWQQQEIKYCIISFACAKTSGCRQINVYLLSLDADKQVNKGAYQRRGARPTMVLLLGGGVHLNDDSKVIQTEKLMMKRINNSSITCTNFFNKFDATKNSPFDVTNLERHHTVTQKQWDEWNHPNLAFMGSRLLCSSHCENIRCWTRKSFFQAAPTGLLDVHLTLFYRFFSLHVTNKICHKLFVLAPGCPTARVKLVQDSTHH